MKELLKGKIATTIILIATFILAGVAVFTAIRLYQLRQVAVAPNVPESNPYAWDCSKYTFTLSKEGKVSINNSSTRSETAQKAKVYINNNLVATFDVPALASNQSAELGTVSLPQSGTFQWKIQGTVDCANSGSITITNAVCAALIFNLTSSSPTPTPKTTGTPAPTHTPTPAPTHTPTPAPTASPTVSPTPAPTASPVPQCNNNCTVNSDCPSDLICSIQSGSQSGNCRRATCTSETDCTCATVTPSPTVSPTSAPTHTPTPTQTARVTTPAPTPAPTQAILPESGSSWATYLGIGIAIITIIGSLALAI